MMQLHYQLNMLDHHRFVEDHEEMSYRIQISVQGRIIDENLYLCRSSHNTRIFDDEDEGGTIVQKKGIEIGSVFIKSIPISLLSLT